MRTCTPARALGGASSIAITPDGKNAYVAAAASDAVAEFARNPDTGALSFIGCISDDGMDRTCAKGNALRGPLAVVASPDGKHVYVAAAYSDSLLTFRRDSQSGPPHPDWLRNGLGSTAGLLRARPSDGRRGRPDADP